MKITSQIFALCLICVAPTTSNAKSLVMPAENAGWYVITAPEKSTTMMGQEVAERVFGQYIDKCKLVDDEYVVKKNALTRSQLCGELDSKSDNAGKVVELILLCRDGRLTEVSFYRDKDRCNSALGEYYKQDAAYNAKSAKDKAEIKASDDRFRSTSDKVVKGSAEPGWWRLQLKTFTCHQETFTARELQVALNLAICSGFGTEALTMIECPASKKVFVMAKTESDCKQAADKLKPQATTISNSEGEIPRDTIAKNQVDRERKSAKPILAQQKSKKQAHKTAIRSVVNCDNCDAKKSIDERMACFDACASQSSHNDRAPASIHIKSRRRQESSRDEQSQDADFSNEDGVRESEADHEEN